MDCLKVDGFDKLISRFDIIEQRDVIKSALEKSGDIVKYSAKEKCPVDTGALKKGIDSCIEYNKAIVGTVVKYAPYVEFGTGRYAMNGMGRKTPWSYDDPVTGETIWTVGQHPQPFLHPALTENAEKIQKIFKQEVRTKIQEVFK